MRPVSSELGLIYLDWVKGRMALADKLSGGKVGYIHLPDTSTAGNRMLQKLFYSQVSKPALIVDDRYNGGGFIPDRMIEYFTRRTLAWWARRGIESFSSPGFAHDGPKAMLINGYSASGGDALPYYFRKRKLGTIIGTRTWGGLIGISGNPDLMDGGNVSAPQFRFLDTEGMWAVEGVGVPPDIDVLPTSFDANLFTGQVISRTLTINNTGGNVTRLRFRVIDLTTFPAPSGIADLRPRTSTSVVVTVDRPPCGSG